MKKEQRAQLKIKSSLLSHNGYMLPAPSDLLYFIEVARLANLSRASESLGLSQPSLTLAMRRLEAAAGATLLIRHKRGITLTTAGKQLLSHARQLLQQWDMVKSKTLASIYEVQGSFIIGCHTSVALATLPKFLGNLLEEHPKLEITLKHNLSRKITEEVISLKIDIGIVVNPTKHPDLVIKHLGDDKVTLWTAKAKQKIQEAFSSDTVLLCDPNLIQTQSILKSLKKRGVQYQRIITSDNLEVIGDLVQSGCGIGILPGTVATRRKLTAIPKAPFYEDEICLLYRGENRNTKAIQVITTAIKKAFLLN